MFIVGDRVGMDGDFVNFDFVEGAVVGVNWFTLHQVQCLEAIDYLGS